MPHAAGAGLKAVWYGAEALGKLLNIGRAPADAAETSSSRMQATTEKARASPLPVQNRSDGASQMSRADLILSLRKDYDCSYFVSGKGEMSAYAEVRGRVIFGTAMTVGSRSIPFTLICSGL